MLLFLFFYLLNCYKRWHDNTELEPLKCTSRCQPKKIFFFVQYHTWGLQWLLLSSIWLLRPQSCDWPQALRAMVGLRAVVGPTLEVNTTILVQDSALPILPPAPPSVPSHHHLPLSKGQGWGADKANPGG